MNSINPADLSPLSYGAGLALGLMLILGLPRAPARLPSAADVTKDAARAGERCPGPAADPAAVSAGCAVTGGYQRAR